MPNTGDYVKATDFDELKPKLSIGTVTTGAAGTNASASITGATPNFKLNLTIPRGNTGATGATGPAGPSGTFTGPLKPTNSYWRDANFVRQTAIYVPSGGTWAVIGRNSKLDATFPNIGAGVLAGGTLIYRAAYADEDMAANFSCWRIQ